MAHPCDARDGGDVNAIGTGVASLHRWHAVHERNVNHRAAILHETTGWLVVDKPAGWHCVDVPRSDGAPTVVSWLRQRRPELAALTECGLVHRLDRETSGCLLVAKDLVAHTLLRAAFSGRGPTTVRKTYLALVQRGIASDGDFTLYFTGRHRGSAKVTATKHGDPATRGTCRWRLLRAASTASDAAPVTFDLIEIDLVGPGRRHQIRAGFASIGHPLGGDALYRGRAVHERGGAPIAVALHASRLDLDGLHVIAPSPGWASAELRP